MNRAVSVSQLMKTEHNTLDFHGSWLDLIGKPERTGSIMIWGNSANGKTRFALQFAKYLTNFGRVTYNALEEGASQSMKLAFRDVGMEECKTKLVLLDKEPVVPNLIKRLEKPKSPNFVFIDSFQYAQLNYEQYKLLIDRFRKKLFVFVSHADGKHPAGRVAKSVRYDAFVKIWVEGFRAFAEGRYGGNGEPYTIWDKGAFEYYGF
jgi:hypothetical protein